MAQDVFGFFFPSKAAVDALAPGSISWIPHRGPVAGGGGGSTSIKSFSGIVSQQLFDRKTFQKHQEYDPFEVYTYAFDNLDDDDRAEFKAFKTVIAGAEFEVLDPIGDVFFRAQIMPDSEDITWQMDIPYGERWSAVISLFVDSEEVS